jgi:hypothetical protein
MTWRAMNSLLVLRGQVNTLAPNRATGADGLVGDANHSTTSDHYPHDVPGVGSEMVTALDLTHDPAGGFDSYWFAEILRQHRDPRIKYVISNRRLFSSYATSSRAAWTWGTYTGTDPHTNHVHISVLDAAISDTSTPWNLGGFVTMADSPTTYYVGNYVEQGVIQLKDTVVIPATTATDPDAPGATVPNALAQKLKAIEAQGTANGASLTEVKATLAVINTKLDQILDKLNSGGGGGTFPANSTFSTAPVTGTIIWNPNP